MNANLVQLQLDYLIAFCWCVVNLKKVLVWLCPLRYPYYRNFRFGPKRENPGLFQIILICVLKSGLKKSLICPIQGQYDQLCAQTCPSCPAALEPQCRNLTVIHYSGVHASNYAINETTVVKYVFCLSTLSSFFFVCTDPTSGVGLDIIISYILMYNHC